MTGDVAHQMRVGTSLLERGLLPATQWNDLLDVHVSNGDPQGIRSVTAIMVCGTSAAEAIGARAWMEFAQACALTDGAEAFVERLWSRLEEDVDLATSGVAVRSCAGALELAFAHGAEDRWQEALTAHCTLEPEGRGALLSQVAAFAHGTRTAVLADVRLAANPLSAAEWSGRNGDWDEARHRLEALLDGRSPERDLRVRRLLFRLGVLSGDGSFADPPEELGATERLFAMRARGDYDEALHLLTSAGRATSPEVLQVLREAGRFDEALALVKTLQEGADTTITARLRETRRRILLEASRFEVLAAPPEHASVEEACWSAIGFLLQGGLDAARQDLAHAVASYPSGPAEREAWMMAAYMLAPVERSRRPVALDWTRFPAQRDNDQLFLEGMRHLLNEERAAARDRLRDAREATLGNEFPGRLIDVALARLEAQEKGR